ncbi:MAG: hypothetical protein GF329_04130 [Candidatus Lokiarchaeota archaeon]|nr:hypothetical protein [Candidatus Lokiarchaeota archaeon]
MIREIWIVQKLRGICLLHRSYSSLTTNPDLLSSFLSGLYAFSEVELSKHGNKDQTGISGIESIDMSGFRWVYLDMNGLLYIIAADRTDKVDILRKQSKVIRQNFLHYFNFKDEKEFCDSWSGNISQFEGEFEEVLDELVQNWEEVDNVSLVIAKKMDLLEIFQQFYLSMGRILKFIPSEQTLAKLKYKMINVKNEKIPKSLNKIEYHSKTGWDITGLLPKEIKLQELKNGLETLLKEFLTALKQLAGEKVVQGLTRKFVFPIILNEFDRLKDLKIDENILHLYLES